MEINAADSSFNDLIIDINTLEKDIEAFPYSSYARYMLLLHYKRNGHNNFEKAAKKTALYFNNTHWLQFQLSQQNAVDNDIHDGRGDMNHFAVLTGEQVENTDNDQNILEKTENSFITQIERQETKSHDFFEEKSNIQNDFVVNIENEEILFPEALSNEPGETIGQPGISSAIGNTNEEKDHTADTQAKATNVESFYKEEEYQNNPDSQEDIDENQNQQSHIQAIKSDEETLLEEHKHNEDLQDETENTIGNGKRIIEISSTHDDTVLFEPLHTVDYFASQGIKIPDEALTNDKLGNQMKSFTEWLRSMKKLQPGKLPQQNSLAENIIQAAAETSNINTEVLTEAMAEVLIKQDKREKAIEMYNKLSLINPSKSAYFAAKIETIKST